MNQEGKNNMFASSPEVTKTIMRYKSLFYGSGWTTPIWEIEWVLEEPSGKETN